MQFIGVWDTVGALGVPDNLGWLNLLDPLHRYDFHDLTLNPHIRHARHALAMDERRGPYMPTLWSEPFAPEQTVKQVWFAGSHKDVGGGHSQAGLSDSALLWMIEEARDAGRVGFNKTTVDQIRPDPLDVLHDDDRGVFGLLEPLVDPVLKPWLEFFLQPRPRAVPAINPDAPNPAIHNSVYDRYQNPPITSGRYRATRILAPGQTETVEVLAREPWNESGLYLEAGEYSFTADGEWMDGTIPSGPGGTNGPSRVDHVVRNPLVEAARLVSTVSGRMERLFRLVTRNRTANFIFSRREEDLPRMSLVGVIANDAAPVKGALNIHERIAIGTGARHRVTKSGYLYAFANDAWGFHVNNQRGVRLTVTRLADQERRPFG